MSQKQSESTKSFSVEGINDTNLFDNDMVRAAKNAIPQKDKERYKRMGEEMYGSVDFETCTALNNMPMPMVEAVSSLVSQLNAGLLLSDVDANEKELLKDAFGEKWYEKWNFSLKD